jgi:hypothetical protein
MSDPSPKALEWHHNGSFFPCGRYHGNFHFPGLNEIVCTRLGQKFVIPFEIQVLPPRCSEEGAWRMDLSFHDAFFARGTDFPVGQIPSLASSELTANGCSSSSQISPIVFSCSTLHSEAQRIQHKTSTTARKAGLERGGQRIWH